MSQMARLTISIPDDLVSFTDEIAKARKISRSRVVSMCLRNYAENMKAEIMKEGYKAMAKEQEDFLDMASDIAIEVIPNWE